MKRIALSCVLLTLVAASAAVTQARLINHVDTPVSVTFNASGQAQVPLDPTTGPIINLTTYKRFTVRVGTTHATSVMVNMGKISGPTLSQMFTRSLTPSRIISFDVLGPEMVLWLTGGPPNTTEAVQLWVYLIP